MPRGVAKNGRSGRPPKPIERKRAAGNPGRHKLPEPLAIVPTTNGLPASPPDLGPAGLDLWRQIWSTAAEWLAPSDVPLVGLLAQFADERARWLAEAEAEGITHTTRHGTIRIHPGIGEARKLEAAIVQVLSLLGLSPSDRARLGLTEVRKLSGLAELAARRADALKR